MIFKLLRSLVNLVDNCGRPCFPLFCPVADFDLFRDDSRINSFYLSSSDSDDEHVYQSQAGPGPFSGLGNTMNSHNVSDVIIDEAESLVALLCTLQGCNDTLSMGSALFLYIKTHFSGAITRQIIDYCLSDIFNNDSGFANGIQQSDPDHVYTQQSGPDSPGEQTEPVDWKSIFSNVTTNWELLKNNNTFPAISKLLGVLVVMKLGDISSLTFSVKDFVIFQPDLDVVHGSAIDVIDAAFKTVIYFSETIYESYTTRSFKPFLISDKGAMELEESIALVFKYAPLAYQGNLESHGYSEHEFQVLLENTCSKVGSLLKSSGTSKSYNAFELRLMRDKYERLLKVSADYTTFKINSGVRRAPFAIELHGKSSRGKTTCGDQMVTALLVSNSLPSDKKYRASYNPSDKFMSTWRTNMNVMVMDDVSNTKRNFIETPPTQSIINMINNAPYYANVAELQNKGKIYVEPEIVLVNTNKKDLNAHAYSECPYSIQRRMDYVIKVEVRPEFACVGADGRQSGLSVDKAFAWTKAHPDAPFDDFWLLTVEVAVEPNTLSELAKYEVVSHNGKLLKDVSMVEVMQFLIVKFTQHRERQFSLIERSNNSVNRIKKCSHEGCTSIAGCCPEHIVYTRQSNFERVLYGADEIFQFPKLTNSFFNFGSSINSRLRHDVRCVDNTISIALVTFGSWIYWQFDWLKIIPTPWLDSYFFATILDIFAKKRMYKYYIISLFLSIFFILAPSIMMYYFWNSVRTSHFYLYASWILFVVTVQKAMMKISLSAIRYTMRKRNIISPSLNNWRNTYGPVILKSMGVLASFVIFCKIFVRMRKMSVQGTLEPVTEDEINERDKEENPWQCLVSRRELPLTNKSKCTSNDELNAVIMKNLVHGTIYTDEENGGRHKACLNGLFLMSNVILIPNHYFFLKNKQRETLEITFRKINPNTCGGKFAARLSLSSSLLVPDTDLRVCYIPNGGSFKDITGWLAKDAMPVSEFRMLYRDPDGDDCMAYGLSTPQKYIRTDCGKFNGGRYDTLSFKTFAGLCGAVITSKGKGSCIYGMHVAGESQTPKGVYCELNKNQIRSCVNQLANMEGVLITGSSGTFNSNVYEVEILDTSKPVHNKSPLRWMPKNSQINSHGNCPGRTTSHSNVRVTPISHTVSHVTGQPNIWGPPKMRPEWHAYQECLSNMSVPALPFEHDLLSLAIIDYKSGVSKIFERGYVKRICPLDDKSNINGIDGKKFIDAIKMNTSIGYPLNGPKKNFISEVINEDNTVERDFLPIIWEEINRCLDCYKRGERANTVAKACKKDEAVSKDKCRIFYSNPIALTFIIRKYFLPIVRVMQMHPIAFECAVGVNSNGPEWEQLHNAILKFGKSRIIGGDYSKYDQRMPSQVILAALRILIDFASACNYTNEDINIMRSMCGDIVYSIIAYNGDLISLSEGSHISGNSLTVIINGIVGSLNMRCAFYNKYPSPTPEKRKIFRDYVSLITYGDDNIGSVSESIDFDIIDISEFLDKYGQIYTMPDKNSKLESFIPDIEFLKRSSYYCPKKNCIVGALCEESIFKPLHCILRDKDSPDTEELACAKNIDGALREWANHGEDLYEFRRIQMQDIASQHELTHLCLNLNKTYDDFVNEWAKNYDPKGERTGIIIDFLGHEDIGNVADE